jgi:hypothetical protein
MIFQIRGQRYYYFRIGSRECNRACPQWLTHNPNAHGVRLSALANPRAIPFRAQTNASILHASFPILSLCTPYTFNPRQDIKKSPGHLPELLIRLKKRPSQEKTLTSGKVVNIWLLENHKDEQWQNFTKYLFQSASGYFC